MRKIIFLLLLLLSSQAEGKKIIVAVIDTGFDMTSEWSNASANGLTKPKVCKMGHYDFENKTPKIKDINGHGTHIAGLIAQNNENTDYCMVFYNYYGSGDTLEASLKAYRRAIDIRVDIINYSGGGEEYSARECALMKEALDAGIVVVAAAGNEGKNLDENPYYPALCDPRIIVVANTYPDGSLAPSSNYSLKDHKVQKVHGTNVMSLGLKDTYSIMTGTSQSTAKMTSKILNEMSKIDYETQKVCTFNYVGIMKCTKTTKKVKFNADKYR
jgi:subtilisin family serine protease